MTAEKLFQHACQLPEVFAGAGNCRKLLAWSVLKQVKVRETGREVTVTNCTICDRCIGGTRQSYQRESRYRMSHIRPYVICKTPSLLKALAKRRLSWSESADSVAPCHATLDSPTNAE